MLRRLSQVACLIAASGISTARAAESRPRQARVHYERAHQCYLRQDYACALDELTSAYALDDAPEILANWGKVLVALERYPEALEKYRECLASPREMSSDSRSDVERRRLELEAPGTLVLEVNVSGAEVVVDQQRLGETPLPPAELSAGHHTLEVRHARYTADVRNILVAPRTKLRVPVTLTASALPTPTAPPAVALPVGQAPSLASVTPPPPSPAAPAQPEMYEGSRIGTPALIAWSMTGVLVTGAAITGSLALARSEQQKDMRKTYPVTPDDLKSNGRRVGVLADITTGIAIAAGASAVLGLWFTFKPFSTRPKHPQAARSGLSLRVAPNGLSAQGEF